MEKIEIIPLVGITLNGLAINLRMSKSEVINLLGQPCGTGNHSLYYFDNELRIDFDQNNNVEFIEFLAGIDGKLQPKIYGVYVFQTKADYLYNILSKKNNGDIADTENGYSYGFLNISVGVFRPSIPENVEEMMEDANEDGTPMDEEEIEYEMRKAAYWATIGIGTESYYR